MDEDLRRKLSPRMAIDENLRNGVEQLSKAFQEFSEQLVKVCKTFNRNMSIILRRIEKYTIEQQMLLSMVSSKEYKIAAKEYPKLAHLASRAKKKRVRKKNIKRLYRLGDGLNVYKRAD